MGRTRQRGGVRPTAHRVRDALFNSLGGRVAEAEVLDLFAGSGALGLEALRRGARSAVFVERDPRLVAKIRQRVRAEGWQERAQVWRGTVRTVLRDLVAQARRFDLIFLDPPYGRGLLQETLESLAAGVLLRPGALIITEGHWRDEPRTPAGLARVRAARYGETGVWEYVRWQASGTAGAEGASGDDGNVPGQF